MLFNVKFQIQTKCRVSNSSISETSMAACHTALAHVCVCACVCCTCVCEVHSSVRLVVVDGMCLLSYIDGQGFVRYVITVLRL